MTAEAFSRQVEYLGHTPKEPVPSPKVAKLASEPVRLLDFARNAGRNMLEVIPDETLFELYVRGPARIHWICDPEVVTELLLGPGRRFPKASFTKQILGSAVGKSMMLSEGSVWREQRQRYAPLFAARNLPTLAKHFSETGYNLSRELAFGADAVDVADISKKATLANICKVMFSGSDLVNPLVVREGLERYFEHISRLSLFDIVGLPSWVPRAKWLRSRAPVTSMRSLARNVIEGRRAERRTVPLDFLDLMIEALDLDNEDIERTVDNLLTFVVAGHETAANTLAWGLYLLALNPQAQCEIRAEIMQVCSQDRIRFDDLQRMPLLRAHVHETLRLYPAAAFFARDASEDLQVKNVVIRRGDPIFFPVYSLHRHRRLWQDPDSYQLDRFLKVKPPRGQFIPFGDGPRVCIGAQYAETEIMVLMASIVSKVRLSLTNYAIPEPLLTFTMRPSGPLRLGVTPVG
jgi:cytochrome P450